MVWAAWQVERRKLTLALTLVSFPALAMFWRGTMEPFLILGAALNAWAIRHWRRDEGVQMVMPLFFREQQLAEG